MQTFEAMIKSAASADPAEDCDGSQLDRSLKSLIFLATQAAQHEVSGVRIGQADKRHLFKGIRVLGQGLASLLHGK